MVQLDLAEPPNRIAESCPLGSLGGWQCIQGDVPATMLMMAQPDEVSEYCEKLIKMGMNGGLILGSGCEVPMNEKPENVAAMTASVR